MQEKPNPAELKSLIHWTETNNIKPKQYMKIIIDTSLRTSNAVNYKTKAKKPKRIKTT
jgi:hypothetical protein